MDQPAIILFDGICNLCNSSINFVIDRDSGQHFRYSALQSKKGQQLMKEHNFSSGDLTSIVLIEENGIYVKSAAALMIARKLTFPWPLLYGFMIIPAFMRNIVYDIIARNRYRWFGKQNECRVPTPELKELFLEE
ncbi:MAG: DCC1-like thiol-disulfide oxidoreductase family protein [Balneolales bacterium]